VAMKKRKAEKKKKKVVKKTRHKTHLTPNEVAELLMVNPVTVRQWAARGLLRSLTTPGGYRRFLLSDVEEFARSRGTVPAPRNAGRPDRVLIVDDDVQLGLFIVEMIKSRDPKIQIEIARDGFEAGAKVESFRPNALLLNMMMPGMDGFEVCRRLRARPALNHIRIVAMTGFPSLENVERIMSAGADACLPKPLDPERLFAELGMLADVKQTNPEARDSHAAIQAEMTHATENSENELSREFVGRDASLQKLRDWALDLKSDPIILVHGQAGVGKTALCMHWLQMPAPHFEAHLRFSFRGGESDPADLYHQILIMSPDSHSPKDLEPAALKQRAVELLRKRPNLILIDDLDEMLVRSGRLDGTSVSMFGAARPDLTALLQALADAAPSKILIISRLVPDALLNASGLPRAGVRLEPLRGLIPSAAEKLLRRRKIFCTSSSVRHLFEPVDFNPRVIGQVADLIKSDSGNPSNLKVWSEKFLHESELTAARQTNEGRRIHLLRTLHDQKLLTELADCSETDAHVKISSGNLVSARNSLEDCLYADPHRAVPLAEEFGFIFSFEGQKRIPALRQDVDAATADWQRRIWSALSFHGAHGFLHTSRPDPDRAVDTKASEVIQPDLKPERTPWNSLSAEAKGEQLELAVARLFRTFFCIGEEIPWKVRQQKRGTQNGYDLSIEWSGKCETTGTDKVRVHVECRNYTSAITQIDVGGKLIMEGLVQHPAIDHWILISPHAEPSNELNRFLETHEKSPQYAFDVQVWSPESGVRDLFALEPDLYQELYGMQEGDLDPHTWSAARRAEVQRQWMARLRPPVRLPLGWAQYAKDPDQLCSPPETPAMFQSVFEHAVAMRCLNSAGILLDKPLRHYVDEWLQRTDQQTLFILGEFGDGKTFFTYALTRDLMSSWTPRKMMDG
jgi:excisionase family DNA binding protein